MFSQKILSKFLIHQLVTQKDDLIEFLNRIRCDFANKLFILPRASVVVEVLPLDEVLLDLEFVQLAADDPLTFKIRVVEVI